MKKLQQEMEDFGMGTPPLILFCIIKRPSDDLLFYNNNASVVVGFSVFQGGRNIYFQNAVGYS
jgi:hypothetical protein